MEYYTLSPVLWNVALLPRCPADGSQPFNNIWSGCLEHLCCDIAEAWCFSIFEPMYSTVNFHTGVQSIMSSGIAQAAVCLVVQQMEVHRGD